ncbi:hypothetical protein CANARDRAFT_5440 [[Candida] arabinofermentans NRRL YB-2248]|uniref:Hcy-binding domain-containing protein n=1 Tax=[Candida] arabinofermentans NRRL YB-2248 TaxID=983967 RepID=A0A1E4T8T5_9ASCO|nr:hypothetical protein CANARDRAFT_5440 [[Candida] arabinofermentans NRRL YB-2248]
MTSIKSLLSERPLLLDGATGTELENRGVNVNDKLWSGIAILSNPDEIYKLHLDYLKSGADLLLTSTYQLSKPALIEKGLNPEDLYEKSIELAHKAQQAYLKDTGKQTYIAGSVGPYGAYLANGSEYTGDYEGVTYEQLKQFHSDRMKYLFESSKIDIIAFETIPSLDEVKVLTEMINELNFKSNTKKPYYLSLSTNHDVQLADGTSIKKVLEFINDNADEQLLAIGSNCCSLLNTTKIVDTLTAEFDHFSNLKKMKIVLYPNSGEVYDGIAKTWSIDPLLKSPDLTLALTEKAREWIAIGNVGIIGGCCRTGPKDIASLRKFIDSSL